jgi:hypothetical protein
MHHIHLELITSSLLTPLSDKLMIVLVLYMYDAGESSSREIKQEEMDTSDFSVPDIDQEPAEQATDDQATESDSDDQAIDSDSDSDSDDQANTEP